MNELGVLGLEGFEQTQQHILDYLEGGRVHPGLILVGPKREEKFQTAKAIATFLICKSRGEKFDPLVESSHARRIQKNLHPDVFIHDEPDESTQIKIESVRQLCHQMEVSSMEGGAKVCIVNDAHNMTRSAANAFLKSLEEPGPDRYFLLLTNQIGSMIPTILSRCVRLKFKPEVDQEQNDPTKIAEMAEGLNNFSRTRDISALKTFLEKKSDCLSLIRLIQTQKRELLVANGDENELEAFENAVEVEGRLKSNANHLLLLEDYLQGNY